MSHPLSGPTADLVGKGMQAVGLTIPVGPVSAKLIDSMRDCGLPVPPKSWFRCVEKNKSKSSTTIDTRLASPGIYNEPILRETYSKSSERPKRADIQSLQDTTKYYTPQKYSSGTSCIQSSKQDLLKTEFPESRGTSAGGQQHQIRGLSVLDLKRRLNSDNDDDHHSDKRCCIYCSSLSQAQFELPCGAMVCSKCNEIETHQDESLMV
ncbi:uncharacterized protein LOC106642078 isoform X2 [Copidosoma floridanum]|uniref:uncharacterized protein LOC106642078 isoform X2 n=1 Tax=Copidosoma floridanum TaxID=29053 RepID=UPI0006C9580E|nr:uncharacterized protein LOC106642078 isoform X2 [Copidosoma floridanum]